MAAHTAARGKWLRTKRARSSCVGTVIVCSVFATTTVYENIDRVLDALLAFIGIEHR